MKVFEIQKDLKISIGSSFIEVDSGPIIPCHYCKRSFNQKSLVGCKVKNCGNFFCRKCLTSKYKFSKQKANQLPTTTWKCPTCTCKCLCSEFL